LLILVTTYHDLNISLLRIYSTDDCHISERSRSEGDDVF